MLGLFAKSWLVFLLLMAGESRLVKIRHVIKARPTDPQVDWESQAVSGTRSWGRPRPAPEATNATTLARKSARKMATLSTAVTPDRESGGGFSLRRSGIH